MKKLYLTIYLIIGLLATGYSQTYQWTRKADLPLLAAERYESVGFSIGNSGYFCTGYDTGVYLNDLWRWDKASNTWTQCADFPGSPRYGAAGFAIGGKAYVGTGWDPFGTNDFYEYNSTLNTWTQKSDFPGQGRYDAVGISTNGKGYIGLGFSPLFSDWWEYDPTNDTWTQRSSFPGGPRQSCGFFSINGKVYVGGGANSSGNSYSDYYCFNPTTDSWSQIADYPGSPRYAPACFSIVGKGFVGSGWDVSRSYNDYYSFDPTTGLWSAIDTLPATLARYAPDGFSIGVSGYVGLGRTEANVYMRDFYQYAPDDKGIGIEEIALMDKNWSLVQNASGDLIFHSGNFKVKPVKVEIFLSDGKLVYSSMDVLNFNFTPHPQTIYLYRLTHPDGYEKAGKLVTR